MVLRGSKQKIQNPWPTFFWVLPNTEFWLTFRGAKNIFSQKWPKYGINDNNIKNKIENSLSLFFKIRGEGGG